MINFMKKVAEIIICTALMLCMGTNVRAAENNVPESAEDSTPELVEEIHSYVGIAPEKIYYSTGNIDVHMDIPVIWGIKDKNVQKDINSKIYDEIMNFKERVEKDNVEYIKDSKTYKYPVNPFSIYVNYNIHFCSKDILSITLDEYAYEGGAHGTTERKSYNINLENGKEISLKDLFVNDDDWKKIISDKVKSEMLANKEIYFEDSVKDFKTIEDNQSFYIEDGNIVVYFGQYEIAPYAAGIREFKIPFTDFHNLKF